MAFGCEVPGDNHSDDLIEVWFGEAEPAILCGYHTQQDRGAILQAVRDRRLAEHATPLDAIPDDLGD